MSDPRADPELLLALDDAVLAAWRDTLSEAGFDESIIARAEAIAPGQLDPLRLPLVHAWLRGLDEAVAPFARLFAYCDVVAPGEVERALGERVTAALRAAGVLHRGPAGECSRVRLMPFAGTLIASDETDATHDPVMGPGATTAELWRATTIIPGSSVLDIGCGAGSLAVAAAMQGASEVVGVDIDPRAVAFARFNARLNAQTHARFEVGDLVEPVAGRRFDLVLSQPPFVMQPPSVRNTTYLHGGERGDELAFRLLSLLPEVIGAQGRALVLLDTPVFGDAGVVPRIRAALGQAALQLLAVSAAGHGPDMQAIGYASATHGDLGPDYAQAVASYRAHLAALGIVQSRHVLLQLRRPREGEAIYAAEIETRGARIYDAGALAEADAALQLASSPSAALLQARVRVSPHAWLVSEQQPGKPEDGRYRLRFGGGRSRDQDLSPAAAALLELAAHAGSVQVVVDEYAAMCETTTSEVVDSVLAFVRESLVSGTLCAGDAS